MGFVVFVTELVRSKSHHYYAFVAHPEGAELDLVKERARGSSA